jgi:hypothetical protein
MRTWRQAAQQLHDIMSVLQGFTVSSDPGYVPTTFPTVIIAPPRLNWDTYSTSQPTEAVFALYVIVRSDPLAVDNLDPALSSVVDAVWSMPDAVVTQAIPAPYGAVDQLPCYVVNVEVSL